MTYYSKFKNLDVITERYHGSDIEYGVELPYPYEKDETEMYAGSWSRKMLRNKDDYLRLGTVSYRDEVRVVKLPIESDILLHGGIFGQTGSGKSVQTINQLIQLSHKGHGFTFVDPKLGNDTEYVLESIPDDRLDDVIYISDKEQTDDGYSIDINPLYRPDYINVNEDVVDQQFDLFKNIIKSIAGSENWGSTMNDILRRFFVPMFKSEKNYTIRDIHYLINNISEIEKYEEAMVDEFENKNPDIAEIVRGFSEQYDSPNDYESLKRRIDSLMTSETAKSFIINEKTDLNFEEIVEENKILLIDVPANPKLRKFILGYITNILYYTVPNTDNKFYPLYVDEFDIILNLDLSPIVEILKRGRDYNFSLIGVTQNPSTISGNVKREFMNNTGWIMTGKLSDQEAKSIRGMYTNIDDLEDIKRPGKYRFLTEMPDQKGSVTGAVKIKGFPKYPPLRGSSEVENIKEKSLRKYGSKDYQNRVNIQSEFMDTDDFIDRKELLYAVYNARIHDTFRNDTDGYGTIDTVINILNSVLDKNINTVAKQVEQLIGNGFIETKHDDMKQYRLTDKGLDKLQLHSGTSSSGGGYKHRGLLQKISKELPKHGMAVKIPEQDGFKLPDGEAYLFEEYDTTPFKNIINDRDIYIEVESSTAGTIQNIHNFSESPEKFTLFVTEDGEDKVEKLYNNRFYQERNSEYGDKMYNSEENIEINGEYPVIEKDAYNWYLTYDNRIVLTVGKDDEKIYNEWESIEAFERASVDDFDMIEKSENTPYTTIKRPVIPENVDVSNIERDDFGIITPHGKTFKKYENGSYIPFDEETATEQDVKDVDDLIF